MRPHRHPHRATWTLLGTRVLLLLVLLAACGSDDDDDDASATTQPEETTTTEAITTTVAAGGPEEWVEVVRGLNERSFALLQNPDPVRVAEVYAETCPCYERTHNTVTVLADGHEHIEGQPVSVTFVKLERPDAATQAVNLTVKEVRPEPWQRVDESGTVVQELPPTEASCAALTLFPDGGNGAYRIHDRTDLTGCPSESE